MAVSTTCLTKKQQVFCEEFLIDLNATQAAIRAGYSKDTAKSIAGENLSKPIIQDYISELMAKRSKKTGITADYVLNNIKEIGERCMQRAPVMKFDHESKEMVQKQDDRGRDVWEFDAANSLKANELLGKHLNLWTDKKEVMGKVTLEQLVAASYGKE